jgi:hypothetical protein
MIAATDRAEDVEKRIAELSAANYNLLMSETMQNLHWQICTRLQTASAGVEQYVWFRRCC